jgi:hypothetical protein
MSTQGRKGKQPTLISVADYVANKMARTYDVMFTITPTSTYYTHARTGHQITQQELDDWYPMPVNLQAKQNYDRRKNWMNGHKSY